MKSIFSHSLNFLAPPWQNSRLQITRITNLQYAVGHPQLSGIQFVSKLCLARYLGHCNEIMLSEFAVAPKVRSEPGGACMIYALVSVHVRPEYELYMYSACM